MDGYQVSMARSAAGWPQMELAERANIGLSTIKDIEKGRDISPKMERKITRVFEGEGIVFVRGGVIKEDVGTRIFDGENFWNDVLDDVYQSMIDRPGEILMFFGDDRESSDETNNRWRKIRNLGVSMRQLVKEDNNYLLGPVNEYRYIPKERFINYVTMVYGDKVCQCAENNTRAVIFRDRTMAATYRNLFELTWQNAEKPIKSTAPDDQRI